MRFGIGEWFGKPLISLTPTQRRKYAEFALGAKEAPICPFQKRQVQCGKKGGVCSLRKYKDRGSNSVEPVDENPVIVCPSRFDADDLVTRWLAKIVGLDWKSTRIAREVPFMESTSTGKTAGRIDLVLANDDDGNLRWFGLEIQAVYFSGPGMPSEFESIRGHNARSIPFPNAVRRPDWRSSSAKRLMPQLQIKVPTLRRWGTKLAVAVDQQFFAAIGGPSSNPVKDLDEGEVIWLVPSLSTDYTLEIGHWETLSLEASTSKLLSARTVNRGEFEKTLTSKLKPLVGYTEPERII
jgi:hypothetical protein